MSLMPNVMDSEEWSIETLLKSLECGTCMDQVYNHWYVCFRRSASLNLHPEYIARTRQYWFVAMLPQKYVILPLNYTGFIFKFNGHLVPKLHSLMKTHGPKPLRKIDYISYGEFLLHLHKGRVPLIFIFQETKF